MRLLEVENSLEAFGQYCISVKMISEQHASRTVDSCTNSDFTRYTQRKLSPHSPTRITYGEECRPFIQREKFFSHVSHPRVFTVCTYYIYGLLYCSEITNKKDTDS